MRTYLCCLFFCSVVVSSFAEERIWANNNNHGGQGWDLDCYCTVFAHIQWVGWSGHEAEKPSLSSLQFENSYRTNVFSADFEIANFRNFAAVLPWVNHIPDWGLAVGNLADFPSGTNYDVELATNTFANTYVSGPGSGYNYVDWFEDLTVNIIWNTNNMPPDTNYYCYFDLEGVAYFGGSTSKYFTAALWVQKNSDIIINPYSQTVSADGAFSLSYGPWEWDYGAFPSPSHWWVVSIPGQLDNQLSGPGMSFGNENNHHYVTAFDFMEYDTNSPYIPPDPNDPTNNPPNNPYVDMPPSWDTNLYGPYPPYYSPWPPAYPPPPPLTQWPQYPPPNWEYNTNSPYSPDYPGPPDPDPDPNNPTNYPDPGGSSNGVFYTLDQWYDMFRRALKDEGNSYIPSDPAQYGITYSNDLLSKATEYTEKFFAAAGDVQTNTDALFVKGQFVISNLSLSLPTTLGDRDSFSWTFPMINEPFVFTVADWPVVAVFRSLCKWVMYLMAFWIAFRMIRRTLGRVSD